MSTVSALTNTNRYFASVPNTVRKFKWLVWLLFIGMTAFLFVGMNNAKLDMTIEGMFEKDDPTILSLHNYHSEFGSEDNLFIVYKTQDGDVLSAKSLAAVKGIREDILARMRALKPGDEDALKHIVKITTLANASVLMAEDDALISRELVGRDLPTTQAELAEIRRIADTQERFELLYLSKDHQYGGIFIETDFGSVLANSEAFGVNDELGSDDLLVDDMSMTFDETAVVDEEYLEFKKTDMEDYIDLMNEVKLVINDPKYSSHLTYYPVGNTAVTEYDLKMIEEMGMLNLGMLVIIAVMLWLLFRSFSAVLWPVVIVILTIVWTFGIIGWLGLPISSLVMITVMLTLAVGIADAVHIMSGYLYFINRDFGHQEALTKAFEKSGKACLLTSITTMLAMFILSLMPMVPVKIFGMMCVTAVGLAFVFTIYLLPLMLDLWAPKKARVKADGAQVSLMPDLSKKLGRVLDGVYPIVQRRPKAIFALFVSFFALCIYGSTLTKVDTNPLGAYPKDSPIRHTFEVVDEHMMGTQNMEILLDLGEINAFQDPYVLKNMDELQHTLQSNYSKLVIRTASLVNVVKHSYQLLHGNDEKFHVIPDSEEGISQTLWMFNNAIPEDRRRLISDNYDKTHISVQMHNAGSLEYTEMFDQMRVDIDAFMVNIRQQYPDAKVSITGMLVLMMQSADYLTKAQLQSFAWALMLISILLLVAFGSVKAGLIAIIPNLIPATLAFGSLGLFDIPLDFTTMMIAPIVIGIAVDDTIHFMNAYRAEVIKDGDIGRAIQATIKETGQAIAFTALILGLGFGIMAFSESVGTANLGRFGALAVFTGLLNDLFLLPAMALIFKLDYKKHRLVQSELVAE
jgi:predicted RND superfamily exporter protein